MSDMCDSYDPDEACARVLQDDNLINVIFAHLEPAACVACMRTCSRWAACAQQDHLWLVHRRQQRLSRLPWSPLTDRLQAEAMAAPSFTTWADEYRRATQYESLGLLGLPVFTRGRDAPDWPAIVASHRLASDESVVVRLVGSPEGCWCVADWVFSWEEGCMHWNRMQRREFTRSESQGRALARNTAMHELINALHEGQDLRERFQLHAPEAAALAGRRRLDLGSARQGACPVGMNV